MRYFLLGLFILVALHHLSILGITSVLVFWNRYGECKLNAYQEVQKEYRLKEVVWDYF